MAFEIRPYPEWSWSQSRRCMFRDCKRLYYYHYYGAHNGWLREALKEARVAYRLKQITNLHLVLGDAVDQAAKRLTKEIHAGRKLPDAETLYAQCSKQLSQAWRDSKDVGLFRENPKYRVMLHEFYYGDGPPRQAYVEEIQKKLRACCANVLKTETLEEAADPATKLLEIPDFSSFRLHETKVFAIPDELYRRGDGVWMVVDWKTGKTEDEHLRQVKTYALWLKAHNEYDGGPIRVRLEYLLSGQSDERALTEADLEQEKAMIAENIAEMKKYLADPDANAPKEKPEFPLTENRCLCRSCNYFELCESELKGKD